MDVKALIANTIVRRFKSLGFAGALRWRILYWAYRITGMHIRHKEWDFVLEYLPKLTKVQEVKVLDVGSTSSLFIYEIARRGYHVWACDIRPYQEKINNFRIDFFPQDVLKMNPHPDFKFDFITCISVLEHVPPDKKREVFQHMAFKLLKPHGRLLITVPTNEYAQGHFWEGFDSHAFDDFMDFPLEIQEMTERAGQICAVITKAF